LNNEEALRKAISYALSAGYQLDKEAFEFLNSISKTKNPAEFMEEVIKRAQSLPKKPYFLNKQFLEEIAKETLPTIEEEPSITSQAKKLFKPLAKETSSQIKIIENPSEEISTSGSIEEYLEYFHDRFR